MSEQPRVGDRVRVRARAFDGELVELDGNCGVVIDGDGQRRSFRMPFCSVEVIEPPRCRASEGATGIQCDLPKGHGIDVDHEGTHDPETAKHDGVGYRLTVRWPWQQWDPDYSDVALPEQEMLAQEEARAQGPNGWEPRVWHSDGPEPAEHVKALRYIDGKPDELLPFLVRTQSGWVWDASPDGPVPMEAGADWSYATRNCPGRYREVES